jgi:hypothetical protein
MFHTIAWRESIADILENDIQPVNDGIWAIQNNHFLPQRDGQILYARYGAAGTGTQARFNSPTFRQISSPRIRPVEAAIVQANRIQVADYSARPMGIKGLEELELLGNQITGGAAVVVGVAGISESGIVNAPNASIIPMLGTGTTTMVAGAWTQVAVTWADILPAGIFAVVGLEFIGVTALAGRLIFEDQVPRPGCVGSGLLATGSNDLFMGGRLGIWGRFNSNRMPNFEGLCNAADTVQTIVLYIQRVG